MRIVKLHSSRTSLVYRLYIISVLNAMENNLLCDLGGKGGASSLLASGQEFRKGTPSVGVPIACLSNLGDGGFVSDLSREWHGFGGRGTSQPSADSLRFTNTSNTSYYEKYYAALQLLRLKMSNK